jgi:hypothetical protein
MNPFIPSEIAHASTETGALEKTIKEKPRSFAELDKSFFKSNEIARNPANSEVSERNAGDRPRSFAELDESFFKTTDITHTVEIDNSEKDESRLFAELDKSFFAIPYQCKNEHLAGDLHPVTGVLFERRIVEVWGKLIDVVVPRFDSAFDAQLPVEMHMSSDAKQFKECNNQLKEAVDKDPELRKSFTREQLEQIDNRDTPDGFTWHHDATQGKMQLVDEIIHMKTSHTGGRSMWGGGSENR